MVSTTVALGATTLTLAVFTAVGLWYSRGRVGTAEDLISARNTAGSGMTTASIVASVMGAWILLSPAEAGAAFGGITAVLGYALGSAAPLLLFVAVGPRVRALLPDGHSLTEYVLARFGRRFYAYVLSVSVFYMFIFLAAEMTGISLALSLVADVPGWQTALLIGVFVLAYTAYGGLVASIFTDTIQTLVILPLLAVGFGGALVALGGTGAIHGDVVSTNPELLSLGFVPGLKFGVYVVFAILGANMLNQGMWQRIWAAQSASDVRRAFGVAAVAVVPMILLSGLFGVAAAGMGLIEEPAQAGISFFLVLDAALPEWIVLVVVVLAVLLVTSSADTLLNAIASIVTADLAHVLDSPDDRTLQRSARGLTVAVALAAIVVGAQGYSVLTLFLLADLLGAATFVPVIHGLYSEELTEGGALVSSALALLVGLTYFPMLRGTVAAIPVVGPALPAPSFLWSFLGATAISLGGSIVSARLAGGSFDLDTLRDRVGPVEEVND